MNPDFAKDYLELVARREIVDKNLLCDNLARIFGFGESRGKAVDNVTLYNVVADLVGGKPGAVFGWMNRSRKELKIPLDKMCVIASTLDFPVHLLLEDGATWYDNDPDLQRRIRDKINAITGGNASMKYAIMLTKDNTEKIVKEFDTLEEAMAYGESFFATLNPGEGVVSCEGHMPGGAQRKFFHCWHH